jgi:hypothetical protein
MKMEKERDGYKKELEKTARELKDARDEARQRSTGKARKQDTSTTRNKKVEFEDEDEETTVEEEMRKMRKNAKQHDSETDSDPEPRIKDKRDRNRSREPRRTRDMSEDSQVGTTIMDLATAMKSAKVHITGEIPNDAMFEGWAATIASNFAEAVPTSVINKTSDPTEYIMEVLETGATLETLSESTREEFRQLESQVGNSLQQKVERQHPNLWALMQLKNQEYVSRKDGKSLTGRMKLLMIKEYICPSTNKMYKTQRLMTDISSLSLDGTDVDDLSTFYLKCVTIMNKSKGGDDAQKKQAAEYMEAQLVDVLKASGEPTLRWATEKYKEKYEEWDENPTGKKPKELSAEWLVKRVEELMKEKNTDIQRMRDEIGRHTGKDIVTGGTYKCMIAKVEDVLNSRDGDPWISDAAKIMARSEENFKRTKEREAAGLKPDWKTERTQSQDRRETETKAAEARQREADITSEIKKRKESQERKNREVEITRRMDAEDKRQKEYEKTRGRSNDGTEGWTRRESVDRYRSEDRGRQSSRTPYEGKPQYSGRTTYTQDRRSESRNQEPGADRWQYQQGARDRTASREQRYSGHSQKSKGEERWTKESGNTQGQGRGRDDKQWHKSLQEIGWIEYEKDGEEITHEDTKTGQKVTSRQGDYPGRKSHGVCLNQWNKGSCNKAHCNYKHEWERNDEPMIAEEFSLIQKATEDKKERERTRELSVGEHTEGSTNGLEGMDG